MHFYERAGLWWPECELPRVYDWMLGRIDSVEKVMRHVGKGKRVCCVQAGGYIGMWPRALAAYFKRVHSFEPVPDLYEVLVKNVENHSRVRTYRQALGERCEMTQLAFRPGGRTILDFDRSLSAKVIDAEMVTVDSLDLQVLDLLYLDTERSELEILRGATATVERDRPVIVLEILDGQERQYRDFMRAFHGYDQVAITHRDAIFTSRGHG